MFFNQLNGWPSMRYVVGVEEGRVNCRAGHLEQLSDSFQFEHQANTTT